ncbi:MAG TPA: trehalase-like domain-containing protein, partial [Candidatus Binatia bacterium]|nr:trehalase-like domain-containing protein [Candidatus Binatia bacterium]
MPVTDVALMATPLSPHNNTVNETAPMPRSCKLTRSDRSTMSSSCRRGTEHFPTSRTRDAHGTFRYPYGGNRGNHLRMATESEPDRSVAQAPSCLPPALDHVAIGNGRVLALISPTSAIEWLCMPRFDSPSLFGRLLDRERGGTCRVLAAGEEIRGDLTYVRNTNVSRIRFERDDQAWEVLDYAPRIPD